MVRHTRVPEILETLIESLKSQPEIDPAQVVDGGVSLNDYANYVIFVGYRPTADEWISVTRRAPEGIVSNDKETMTIGFLFAATNPEHNMSAARALVAEKLGALERIVTEDMTLGLSGVTAVIASHAWLPLHTSKGGECNVSVDLQVEVLL
jgi:hypothetical protein